MNEQSLKNKINFSLNNSRYRLFETTGSLFARSMKLIGALDTIPHTFNGSDGVTEK